MVNTHDTVEAISNFLKAISELDTHWEQICSDISKTDMETEDILHELELSRLNASEGYYWASQLQDVRKRRRDSKDQQSTLLPFKQWADRQKSLTIDLYKTLNSMKNVVKMKDVRVYHPRVRTDLKLCKVLEG